jgi:hypothetical protein
MWALIILFGLLQLYPGVSAVLLGAFDPGAPDRAEMIGLGIVILLASFGFVASGLKGLLSPLVSPESLVEG